MPHFEKHFTLEEAEALLPELRDLLQAIQQVRDHIVIEWKAAAPVLAAAKSNGGGKEGHGYLTDVQQLRDRVRRLTELGVQLKDVDRGLVDFPTWRDGREVHLCWHLGEERIGYWHELDSGYSGRHPL